MKNVNHSHTRTIDICYHQYNTVTDISVDVKKNPNYWIALKPFAFIRKSELVTYFTMTKKVVCTHVPLIHVGDLAARGYWYYFPHVFWTEYLIFCIIDIKIRQKITCLSIRRFFF